MKDVFVITGGSGGMGSATAALLGKRGIVLLADVSEERLEATKTDLLAKGIEEVYYQTIDITDREKVKALVERTKELGNFKGLIHMAGLSQSMADAKRILEVNLIATGVILDEFIEIATPGSVTICISSMTAYMVPTQGEHMNYLRKPLDEEAMAALEKLVDGDTQYAYAYSKLGVKEYVEEQAWAWGQKGARLVSIAPGVINTPMSRLESKNASQMQTLIDNTPLGREGEATDIANTVDLLVDERAGFLSGIDILCDGGAIANFKKISNSVSLTSHELQV